MKNVGLQRDKDIDKIIEEAVGPNSKLNPVQHSIFHRVVEYVEYTEKSFSAAELIPALESMIEGSAFLSIASEGASILSIVLFPLNALMEIVDAYELGMKLYTLRGMAYTITAWAFNKPVPVESRQILSNLRHKVPVVPVKDLVEHKKKWKEVSIQTLHKIKTGLLIKNVKEDEAKVIFRALGEGNPVKLCLLLMKGMEESFEVPIYKQVWISNYRIMYPH